MFDKLTHELLDLTAAVHGERSAAFALVVDCCCTSCCGCVAWC